MQKKQKETLVTVNEILNNSITKLQERLTNVENDITNLEMKIRDVEGQIQIK